MKILAAIPCYNEGLAIGSVALKAGATVVAHEENQGKGCAVKNALRYAVEHGFDALVLLDGDGQHDPNEIPQLLEPITNDTADIVIGFRSFGQMPACIQTDRQDSSGPCNWRSR